MVTGTIYGCHVEPSHRIQDAGARPLKSLALLLTCRGLLRRARQTDVATAVDEQPGWPLAQYGPMVKLLGAGQASTPSKCRIIWANTALADVDQDTESAIGGWVHSHLVLGTVRRRTRDRPMPPRR